MKKILLVLAISLVFAGCSNNQGGETKQFMDRPAEDGKYYYENDLGFSLVLPEEFIYYQVQRKNKEKYADVEFFIPTSDTEYPQEVPSYAKPIVIRMYRDLDSWEELKDGTFEKLKTNDGKVYAIKFWDKIPKDWENKWTSDMKSEIFNSFK